MKIHCDNCGKECGDFLYGHGGVEEKAIIKNHYILVNDYDEHGRHIGNREVLGNRMPDVICFDCNKNNLVNVKE